MQMDQLQKEMIAAMKNKDKFRKETISTLVSAAKKIGIDEGCREDIPEEVVTRAILKELKMATEQLTTCPDERADLKEEYAKRVEIITEFAPSMMSEEEVKTCIMDKFADLVATKNKGTIMKSVMQELKGKADGQVINKVVADLCK